MRTLPTFHVLLPGLLFLTACSGTSIPEAVLANETTTAAPVPEAVPELVIPKIGPGPLLAALFTGTPTADGRMLDRPVDAAERQQLGFEGELGWRSTARAPIVFGPTKNRTLVVIESALTQNGAIMDCHACPTTVGLAVFDKVPEGWRLAGAARNIGSYGAFGQLGPHQVVKAGQGRHLFHIASAFGTNGQFSEEQHFFSLSEDGSPIRKVFGQPTEEKYEVFVNDDIAYAGITGKLKLVPGPTVYDDIQGKFTNSKEIGTGTLKDSSWTELHRYDSAIGVYKRVE